MDDMLLTEPEAPPALTLPARRPGRPDAALSAEQAERLVLTTVARHADQLLRTARRYSMCMADAEDAYQRALEIFMRRAATLDAERAPRWLSVVVRNEALAVRRARGDVITSPDFDLETLEAPHIASPEDHTLEAEQTTRAAEALQRLKPHELHAMWLQAMGNTYQEISSATGWSYTKVNRCLTEGRRSFLERYAGIETGRECERWAPVLSSILDGEATAAQIADARPHLRNCPGCRATLKELRIAGPRIAMLLPPGALAPMLAESGGGHGVLSRVWDAITVGAHERATAVALKVQALVEAAATTKTAAVAASAAAVAGGGAAVAERAVVRDNRAAAVDVRQADRSAASKVRTATRTAGGSTSAGPTTTSPAATSGPAATSATNSPTSAGAGQAKTTESGAVAEEFVEAAASTAGSRVRSTAPAARAASAPTPAAPRADSPAAGNGGEFDP
jgi:RNA polymerase sigma factor (sigma-70 family)